MTSDSRAQQSINPSKFAGWILLLLILSGCAVGKIATSPPQLDVANRNRLEVLMDETGAAARDVRVALSKVIQSGETGNLERLGAQTAVMLTNLSLVLTTLTVDPRLPGAYTNRLAAILDELTGALTNANALLTNVKKPTADLLANISALAVSATSTVAKASRLLDKAESLGAGLALRQGIIPSDYEFIIEFLGGVSGTTNVSTVWSNAYSHILTSMSTSTESLFSSQHLEDVREVLGRRNSTASLTNVLTGVVSNIVKHTNFGAAIHAYLTNLISVGVPIGARPPLRISFLVRGNIVRMGGFSGAYSDYERDTATHFGPILPVAKEIQEVWLSYRDSPGRRHLRTFRIAPAPAFWTNRSEYPLDRVLSGAEPIRVIAEHSLVSLDDPSMPTPLSEFGLELNLWWDPAGEAVLSGTVYGFLRQGDGDAYKKFMVEGCKELSAIPIGRIYAVRHTGNQSPAARR